MVGALVARHVRVEDGTEGEDVSMVTTVLESMWKPTTVTLTSLAQLLVSIQVYNQGVYCLSC